MVGSSVTFGSVCNFAATSTINLLCVDSGAKINLAVGIHLMKWEYASSISQNFMRGLLISIKTHAIRASG